MNEVKNHLCNCHKRKKKGIFILKWKFEGNLSNIEQFIFIKKILIYL